MDSSGDSDFDLIIIDMSIDLGMLSKSAGTCVAHKQRHTG